MMRRALRRLAPLAWCAGAVMALPAAHPLGAQDPFGAGARLAPQFFSYKIASPSNLTISEMAIPLYVILPMGRRLTLDVGTSYASSRVEQRGATRSVSTVSGLTDTQVRANLSLGTDFVVLTAGVNLPTGRSGISTDEQIAAGLIGSDFLAFPISNMGTGFGGTGGIAIARPLGSWNVGAGVSLRRSARYDPFDTEGGAALHYQPGDEYRVRLGVDHPLGTGRVALGFTYLTFGNDNLAGSIYNTGDRYLSQLDVDDDVGPGHLVLSGWNLFRARGTLANGVLLDHENIANGMIRYAIPSGSVTIEPNVEGRVWTQVGAPTSALGTFGLRAAFQVGALSVVPSAGYTVGQIAATSPSSVVTSASLTGFRGALAIRLR